MSKQPREALAELVAAQDSRHGLFFEERLAATYRLDAAWKAAREALASATPAQAEPVAWRTRYRSEPGMIGHYPWTYTGRKPNDIERPSFETEPLYATPASQTPAEGALKDRIAAAIREHHLTSTYHCTRVWQAWGVGTMSEDDFEPAGESDMPEEIADTVIALLATQAPAAAPQPIPEAGAGARAAHILIAYAIAELARWADDEDPFLQFVEEVRPWIGEVEGMNVSDDIQPVVKAAIDFVRAAYPTPAQGAAPTAGEQAAWHAGLDEGRAHGIRGGGGES